ncbi:hypothetical protein [Enterococcus faecium]|uniref:hypothetical protein n=1 Tax=Enterococcus faecium TaxID=1352 RepID=UPI000E06ACC5|nr:hypothetical protein [Enterococcus faecium]STE28808.1 Uncharacterised protein [Enterococcus faecium]
MKSIKILDVLAIVGTSLISFTPALLMRVVQMEALNKLLYKLLKKKTTFNMMETILFKKEAGEFLGSLLGGLSKSPTAEELNGSRTKDFKAKNCGPYGQGGTPNSCNFRR